MKAASLLVLIGSVLAGAVNAQDYNPQAPQSIEQRVQEQSLREVVDPQVYQAINQIVIREFVAAHLSKLDAMRPRPTYYLQLRVALRDIRDDNGKIIGSRNNDEVTQELIEGFSEPHRLCLDLAIKHQKKKFGDIKEQEFHDLGRQIRGLHLGLYDKSKQGSSNKLGANSGVNYNNKYVLHALSCWGLTRTEELHRLVQAELALANSGNQFQFEKPDERLSEKKQAELIRSQQLGCVNQLYEAGFTRNGYIEHLKDVWKVESYLKERLKASVTSGRLVTELQINKIANAGLEVWTESIDVYFPQQETQ